MKLLLILLFCLNSYNSIYGAEVAQCTAINFNLNVSLKTDTQTDLKFSYSGNIAVAAVDSFHSIIHLTNTSLWSSNSSIYYQTDVPYFSDLQSSWILCPTLNGSGCNLTVLDGYMFFRLPMMLNGADRNFGIAQYLVVDQGTLVNNDGFSFDSVTKPCMSFTESHTDPLVIQNYYCCTNYTYMTVPDEDPNPCTEFKATTMVTDVNDNIVGLLTTTYGITSSGLNVTLTTNLLQPPFITSEILPNYITYSCVSSMSASCNFMLKRGVATNSLYNMVVLIQTEDGDYGIVPSIKIIKRNGIYLKNNSNQPFTPNDSCSSVTTPFIHDFRSLNTLCCTKFQNSKNDEMSGKVVQSKRKLRGLQPKPFKQSEVS